ADHIPQPPNGLRFSRPLAPSPTPPRLTLVGIPKRKKAPISRRASGSAGTACWAAGLFLLTCMKQNFSSVCSRQSSFVKPILEPSEERWGLWRHSGFPGLLRLILIAVKKENRDACVAPIQFRGHIASPITDGNELFGPGMIGLGWAILHKFQVAID